MDGSRGIRWTHSYWGEIASGMISADMSGQNDGWLRVQLGNLDQTIILVARHRHFGGKQWYFMCENRPASVLWKPNGATRFCSRQTWGRRVAYQSQFNDATNRAHSGKARIKSRLIADLDPNEWIATKTEMDAVVDVQSSRRPLRPLPRSSERISLNNDRPQ